MGMKSHAVAPAAALGSDFFALPASIAIGAIGSVASLVSADIGNFGFILPPMGQPATLTKEQSDALAAYNEAVNGFKSILGQRRAQIDLKQPLPNLPGQALYLARNSMMSAYKDLTDAVPSRIGGPNKFKIPPAYFDADLEPLLDEYRKSSIVMQAPPANAQKSDTPFKDVVDLGTVIARARGLDAANAEAAGRISLGLFFAETNGNQNIGNARSNKYKGSLQAGPSEDQNGRRKWAAIKPSIAAFDPALEPSRRQGRGAGRQSGPSLQPLDRGAGRADERARGYFSAGPGDREDAARSDRSDETVRTDPDHSRPTRSALRSGNLLNYRISDPTIMGYLRNNSIFAFGRADRARTSASFREILDAMWLFNPKFEQALSRFDEIKARQKG